jgi:hypothetical protein
MSTHIQMTTWTRMYWRIYNRILQIHTYIQTYVRTYSYICPYTTSAQARANTHICCICKNTPIQFRLKECHRTIWPNQQRSWMLFRMWPIRITVRKPGILTEVFHAVLQLLHENAIILLQSRIKLFPLKTVSIHYSPIIFYSNVQRELLVA